MNPPWGLLLPAIAGVGYAIGALLLKIAIMRGAGPWRAAFLSNLMLAGIMQFFWFALDETPIHWANLFYPTCAGLAFFLGQIATFLSLQSGHVSVATPLLGSKVLWITILSALLLREAVPIEWWIGASMAVLGITILGYQPGVLKTSQTSQWPTIAWGLTSALFFSGTDLMVQESSRFLPPAIFLPVMFAAQGIFSLGMIPLFRSPLSRVSKQAWPWLAAGSGMIALQAVLMAIALVWFAKAAEVNIVYNSRGLWSIVLALIFARFLGLGEQQLTPFSMFCRGIGALLLLAAIWVVV